MDSIKPLNYLERALLEIRAILLNDEEIRKLLYIDSPDALMKEAPTTTVLEPYIVISPIESYAINNFEKNSFMMIDMPKIQFVPGNSGQFLLVGTGLITFFTNIKLWLLSDNRLRVNAVFERVILLLHEKKLASVGPLYISGSERINFSTSLSGIIIGFAVRDDQTTVGI